MSDLRSSMNVNIPELCGKQCFGDVVKMSDEEKKCLTVCFQRHRN